MSRYAYIENFETWQDGFSFFININIRFSETDMFGHMNNVSAFVYFEEARIEFLKHVGLFDINKPSNEVPIVADLQCDYQQQVFFGEQIKLYVKANRVGNSSVDLHYMAINQKEQVCFTGRGNMVKINIKTNKAVPFKDEEKRKLKGEN